MVQQNTVFNGPFFFTQGSTFTELNSSLPSHLMWVG